MLVKTINYNSFLNTTSRRRCWAHTQTQRERQKNRVNTLSSKFTMRSLGGDNNFLFPFTFIR